MRIELDREKRIELLRWLKQGFADSETLEHWLPNDEPLEVLEKRIEHLYKCGYPSDCYRLKKIGCCAEYNRIHGIIINGIRMPKDSEDIPLPEEYRDIL